MSSVPPVLNRQSLKKKSKWEAVYFLIALFAGGLLVLMIIGGLISKTTAQSSSSSEDKKMTLYQKERNHRELIQKIKVTPSWSKEGFGNIGMLHATIENNSDIAVKDVVIKMIFAGQSGTETNVKVETIYKQIPPHKSIKTGNINMGFINPQSTQAAVVVLDAVEDYSYSPSAEKEEITSESQEALNSYKAKVYRAVNSRWYVYVQNRTLKQGNVRVRFYINSDGTIGEIKFVKGDENSPIGKLARRAILDVGSLESFSGAMQKKFANGYWEEMDFEVH